MRPVGLVIPAKAGTHRPRTRPGPRPVGAEHDLPPHGLPGPGHLLGAAAWGERGCGDDVRGTGCRQRSQQDGQDLVGFERLERQEASLRASFPGPTAPRCRIGILSSGARQNTGLFSAEAGPSPECKHIFAWHFQPVEVSFSLLFGL